jgi:antitoxin component YwqK of YwqJK toxin-antitoxin module
LYFENGILSNKTNYINNQAEGPYKNYYESGRLREEGVFTDTEDNGYYTRYYDMSAEDANALIDGAAALLGESSPNHVGVNGMVEREGVYRDGKDFKKSFWYDRSC